MNKKIFTPVKIATNTQLIITHVVIMSFYYTSERQRPSFNLDLGPMNTPQNWLLVTAGGILGTLARFGVYVISQNRFAHWLLPSGTLIVNILGCALAGFAAAVVYRSPHLTESFRVFFMMGFLGAFTTFSAFSVDTLNLFMSQNYTTAALNVVVQNIIGLGITLATYLVGVRIL